MGGFVLVDQVTQSINNFIKTEKFKVCYCDEARTINITKAKAQCFCD